MTNILENIVVPILVLLMSIGALLAVYNLWLYVMKMKGEMETKLGTAIFDCPNDDFYEETMAPILTDKSCPYCGYVFIRFH